MRHHGRRIPLFRLLLMRDNTGTMPTVKVRFFARLADIAGTREAELEIGEGITAAAALDLLARRYPGMDQAAGSVMYAVNAEYVNAAHPLQPGDELALIPPVSGGAGAV